MITEFFEGDRVYPPLIPKENNQCGCSLSKEHKQRIYKVGTIAGLALGLPLINLTAAYTLATSPVLSFDGLSSLAVLGLEAFTASAAAALYCVYRRGQKAMIEGCPYSQYHRGTFWTVGNYHMERTAKISDPEFMHPLLARTLDQMEVFGILQQWKVARPDQDRESVVKYLFEELQEGICLGYSLSALSLMRKYYSYPCEDLEPLVQLEKAVFFQCMSILVYDFCNDYTKRERAPQAHSAEPPMHLESDDRHDNLIDNTPLSEQRSIQSNLEVLLRLMFKVGNGANSAFCYDKTPSIQLDTPLSEIKGAFNISRGKVASHFVKRQVSQEDVVIVGTVEMYSETGAHAISFQLSDGHYRFLDSGSALPGFYEFPDEDTFFDVLRRHIESSAYHYTRFSFTVWGIEKEGVSPAIEVVVE